MEHKSEDLLGEVMLKARLVARAKAPPIEHARMLSQVRLRDVFDEWVSRESDESQSEPQQ